MTGTEKIKEIKKLETRTDAPALHKIIPCRVFKKAGLFNDVGPDKIHRVQIFGAISKNEPDLKKYWKRTRKKLNLSTLYSLNEAFLEYSKL